MSKLYNEEVKNRYLQTYDNEGTQKTINNIFIKSEVTERTLNKDLYNFSTEDLINVFKEINPMSKSVSMSAGRFIKSYISWCIKNGYRDNNDNPLNGVSNEWYEQFIDKRLKIHYSKEEFISLLEDPLMMNGQDQAFLSLLFEGLSGNRFSEIQTLKFSDVDFDNKTVYVKDRDQLINVSDDSIKYLLKAYNQNTYFQWNSNGDFNEKELLPSEFIFKNVKSPRGIENQPVKINVFYSRLHALKEIFELDLLTPNAIRQSGMIWEAVKIYREEGVLAYEQLAKIGKKYNYSQLENGGYIYYNTYLMREFLNESNIKDLYDIDLTIEKR